MQNTTLKKPYTILLYGHVDILWTYQGSGSQMDMALAVKLHPKDVCGVRYITVTVKRDMGCIIITDNVAHGSSIVRGARSGRNGCEHDICRQNSCN